jgi:ribonuclease-3
MKLSAEHRAFCDRLGHQFSRPELLLRALTHGSMSSVTRADNQRLEFLGDRVLNLVIAEALFRADPEAQEGKLAPRYNALVRKETCAEVARDLGLGKVLRLGRGEMQSGGRKSAAILADAMEAVLAAIYLDAGLEPARGVILAAWGSRIAGAADRALDAKTALQEWAQARGEPPPTYSEVGRTGPAHRLNFTIEVRLSSGPSAQAEAGSKRQAEQMAATALLAQVTGDSDTQAN